MRNNERYIQMNVSLDGATIVLSESHLNQLAMLVAQVLGDRFQAIESKLADIDSKLDEVESAGNANESRLDDIESKLDDVDFDDINSAVDKLENFDDSAFDDIKSDVSKLDEDLNRVNSIFAKIVSAIQTPATVD